MHAPHDFESAGKVAPQATEGVCGARDQKKSAGGGIPRLQFQQAEKNKETQPP